MDYLKADDAKATKEENDRRELAETWNNLSEVGYLKVANWQYDMVSFFRQAFGAFFGVIGGLSLFTFKAVRNMWNSQVNKS